MDVFTDRRIYLLLLCMQCVCFIISQGEPNTPETYYAVISSTAELPCAAGKPGDRLNWFSKNKDGSLRSRTSSYKDKDLLVNVIKTVRLSDAGTFYCSDGTQSSSLDLVVIEPSQVLDTQAKINGPDEIKVKWKAPLNNPEAVRGYNIYISEIGQSDREVKVPVNNVKSDGEEEFDLTDFIPGATYEIQVAPLYRKGIEDGDETVEGPRSPKVWIETPKFEASPWKVKAEPWKNSTVLVTWQPPRDEESRGVDGYIVHYQGIGKKDAPKGDVTVTQPDQNSRWSAVLKGLKTPMKYKIDVSTFTGGSQKIPGGKSQEITIAHDGFKPELSIRALPLSPDTVLLTLDTVGGDKVEKLRLFYSDESAINWDKVDGYKNKENYAVVTGLQPRTRYFFMAKASVNKKARSVVTHVLTPPPGLSIPTNVNVTANSDSSVQVSWAYFGLVPALGFIVRVEKEQPGGIFSPDKQHVVFKENEAVVPDLNSKENYLVKVEPFDVEGVGSSSESILFQLGAAGEMTSPAPERELPYFVEEPPEEVHINVDEDVKLTCTALGKPDPTIQWFKDGVPVGKSADRANQLTLSGLQESTVLTCKANNEVGTAERQTTVHVTRRLEPEGPRFVEPLPETLVVNRSGDIRQLCHASGYPLPMVTWFRNGNPLKSSENVPGQNVLTERRINRPSEFKCVASNPSGSIEGVIKVFIKDMLKNPSIRNQLPKMVEKTEGEQLTIPCSFSGHPVPEVTWFDGSSKLGEPMAGQNTLKIDSVEKTTFLTCRGENLQGKSEETVHLKVRPRVRPVSSDYEVSLKHVSDSPSDVKVKWNVNRGNLKEIRHFDIKLETDRGQVVFSRRLSSEKRSMNFRQLSPQTRYTFSLYTVTSRGVVDNSTTTFIITPPNPSNNEPVLYLDVVEIRDSEALIDFSTKYLNPRQIGNCRLRVKDLDIGDLGNTLLNKDGLPLDTSIVVERLKPYSNYQVIVTAVFRGGFPFLEASANFSTPGPGEYGTPVNTSSDSSSQSPQESTTTAEAATVSTRMTQPSAPPRTLPAMTTMESTVTFSSSVMPDEEDNDYLMTAKIPSKTHNRVDVRWTVDRGPLENIRDFLVTFKGERGQTLLQQSLPADQRYITVQPLNPNTKYFVNVKANGPEGILAESDVAFQTDPVGTVPDTSSPVLELEANEVRADNVRIEWTLVGAEPDLIKSYRLKVLDGGPDGINLLNRQVDASSQSLNLKQLLPNTRYHVIAEALAADGSTVMTSSLTFETASPNKNGNPVQASSRSVVNPGRNTKLAPPADAATPVLELVVSPAGESSANLMWSLENIPVRAVSGYTLNVRNSRPDGAILLSEKLRFQENGFRIDSLRKDRTYYFELEAVSPSGSTVVRAATPYTHGRSNTPFKVTSNQQESESPPAASPETNNNSDEESADGENKPEIDLELNPVGQDQVRVNWSIVGGSRSRPIISYKIKVKQDGPQGRTVHENQFHSNTAYYTVSGLQANTNYYVHLDALDRAGHVIEYVSTPYLVPPPGFSVEPLRTSSVFKKAPSTTVVNYDRGPEDSDLVITKAEVQGPAAILLEWFDVTSGNGIPSRNTMIRYAEFKDNRRGRLEIQQVPSGQRSTTIRNLKPDTTYGIQVASLATGAEFVRWSKLVLRKTE